MTGPLIENLETTLRNGGVPRAPYQPSSAPMPNFANVQLPASLPSPAAPIRSTGPVLFASQSSSNASTPPSSSPSPRSISLTFVPPHVSPARVSAPSKPIEERGQVVGCRYDSLTDQLEQHLRMP